MFLQNKRQTVLCTTANAVCTNRAWTCYAVSFAKLPKLFSVNISCANQFIVRGRVRIGRFIKISPRASHPKISFITYYSAVHVRVSVQRFVSNIYTRRGIIKSLARFHARFRAFQPCASRASILRLVTRTWPRSTERQLSGPGLLRPK